MIFSWGLLGDMSGTSGIAAAKFYLDFHPNSQVAMLERDNGPGGVWNASQALSDRQI